jgi:hypothetical protein
MVLRDLLGHTSVLTTEKYLRRLDTTRVFREAYERTGQQHDQAQHMAAAAESDAEFSDDGWGGEV